MEVNVEKIWMKNKMKKGVKFSLLLRAECWTFRRDSRREHIAVFKWVFIEITSRFVVH